MKRVFIVDDSDTNLLIAKSALEKEYKAYPLPSAEKMFRLLEKIIPDLILLDIDMPDISGFTALELLKSSDRFRSIPVIFLTAKNNSENEVRGFEIGALDFISKPFSPPVLLKRVQLHIETDKLIKSSQKAVRDIHNAAISVIADMVENRDKVTGGHIERTQIYLERLVEELSRKGVYSNEISTWDLNLLLPSAQLHDVGKISISDLILNKPGLLEDEEYELIKQHCTEGERIIDKITCKVKDDGFLLHAKRFAGYHHEKWDGTGYPRKLSGSDIPLEGRLMAIVDVYDALISQRPYKEAYPHDKALEIISHEVGKFFDPQIADVFLDCFAHLIITGKHGK